MHVRRKRCNDIRRAQRATVTRLHEPEVVSGIKPPQPQVAAQCVGVGCEVEHVAHDDASRRVCLVEESSEQLVEIVCGLAGDADLVGRCTQERRELFCRRLGESEPGWVGLGPTADAELSPLVEGAQQARLSPA